MKRLITILLSAALCACFCPLSTRAGEDVDSLQSQIAALQAENEDLKEQLESTEFAMAFFIDQFESALNGDINGDGYTDAVDASLILSYYSYSSSHEEPITLREYLLGGDSVEKSR